MKFNGVLKFAGKVKIRGFDTFSRHNSREGRNHVSYDSTLKLLAEDAHTGFTYITRDIASVIKNQWGDRIQNYKLFYLL